MAKIVDQNGYWKYKGTKISRTGIFPYAGWQINDELPPDKIFMVYRPFEELSRPETIESFNGIPFIEDHEMIGKGYTPVDSRTAAGTLFAPYVQGIDLFGDIVVYSESVQNSISNGKQELSLGYLCVYEPEKGVFEGERYDFKQTNILGNHIALVEKGRMGSTVRVQDSNGTSRIVDLKQRNAQDSFEFKKKFQVAGDAGSFRLVFDTIETINESEYMPEQTQKKSVKLATALVAMGNALDEKTSSLLLAAMDSGEGNQKKKTSFDEAIKEVFVIAKDAKYNGGEKGKTDAIAKIFAKAGLDEEEESKKSEDEDEEKKKSSESKDEEEKTSEDEESEAKKKSEDKAKGMDASAIIKVVQDAADFYSRVRAFTGDFEHGGKTAAQIAVDAAKILKLECSEDAALPTVNGYLAAAKSNNITSTLDSSDGNKHVAEDSGEDAAYAAYLAGK